MIHSTKLANQNRKVINPCSENIHKYRRFSKQNKTYHTDRYYCDECGKQRKLEDMYGVTTRCQRCNNPFSFKLTTLPIFPLCNTCIARKKGKTINTEILEETRFDFLGDETKNENIEDKTDKGLQLLKELGLS